MAVIGIVEITRAAIRVGARTYEPLPPFIFALVLYSLIVFVFVKTQRALNASRAGRAHRHERVSVVWQHRDMIADRASKTR